MLVLASCIGLDSLVGGSDGDHACEDFGAHFGYPLHAAGIQLRYKSYSYRWHYRTAVQMHHKYVLIDGHSLVSGSYNISSNAEYANIENAVVYTADRYPSVVAAFQDNMDSIWETGLADDAFDAHIARIESADESGVALLFDPMALDWDQVDTLREAIRTACPDVDSTEYRSDPTRTMGCSD
jgi:phosphatidylserine/phosphatidylglycerophosphate/cardiolipin synthase-like enzyme